MNWLQLADPVFDSTAACMACCCGRFAARGYTARCGISEDGETIEECASSCAAASRCRPRRVPVQTLQVEATTADFGDDFWLGDDPPTSSAQLPGEGRHRLYEMV